LGHIIKRATSLHSIRGIIFYSILIHIMPFTIG
jgi:hypothetical protein